MKKIFAILLSMVLMLGALAACGSKDASSASASGSVASTNPDELSGKITLWTWADNTMEVKELFNKSYPNIELDVQIFGGDEYKTKLMTTLQSGKGIPDLFMLEEGYVYDFLDSDVIEDLSARGYEDKLADYYSYMREACRATDGTIRAINYQSSPVGFWYLRDAMEKWLGTSDPAELSEMLGSWDKILEASKKVQEDSNGTVYLWPNVVEMVKVVGYSYEPFVRDGKFSISDDWYGLLDDMREFRDSGYTSGLDSWGNDWAAKWNAGELLIRVMPSWDFFTDWDVNEGNVGIIKPFENAYEGGSFVSMWSGGENKELCDVFLQFLTSPEFQRANMEEYNQVPANAAVTKTMAEEGYSAEKFGGQNLMETYDEINSNVNDFKLDKYTRPMQNLFQKHASEGMKNNLDNDTIIENFKQEARDKYPELEIA